MTRGQAERLVVGVARSGPLAGSDRELPLDVPLADLGLDSLALVTLVSELEVATGTMFPDAFWRERQSLCLVDLVDVVERGPAVTPSASPEANATLDRTGLSLVDRVAEAFEERGSLHGAAFAVTQAARHVTGHALGRLDVVIVVRDLDDVPPRPPAPDGVVLRRIGAEDETALAGLWPRLLERRKRNLFRSRISAGYVCLAAFDGGGIVAVDWLTEFDHVANVAAGPGTCLGVDLYERRDQQGRGVGLALLAFSLAEARAAGYRRQAAVVATDNAHMLAASIGLLGFVRIGTARRTSVLGRIRWDWELEGTAAGRGRWLVL